MIAALLIAVAAVPAAGLLYQWFGLRRDRRRFPPGGRMVRAGADCSLHLQTAGKGPVVVLEAGIAATGLSWRPVQEGIARFATACCYDRAGLGWSEPGRGPRTPARIAQQLHDLLGAAQLPAPYVLVGHSFGGLVVQRFASLFPEEVRALVLVDPLDASEWYPLTDQKRRTLDRGIRLSRRGATLARFGIVRASLSLLLGGSRWLPRLAGRVSSGSGGSGFMDRIAGEIRKLPRDLWPVIAAHWSDPKAFAAMAEHLESLPESAAEIARMPPLDVPAVVIVAAGVRANPAPALPRAEQVVASQSGHWVQLDEPELIVDAIRRLSG